MNWIEIAKEEAPELTLEQAHEIFSIHQRGMKRVEEQTLRRMYRGTKEYGYLNFESYSPQKTEESIIEEIFDILNYMFVIKKHNEVKNGKD